MDSLPHISSVAFLIADPTRAAMLLSLMDGSARPAGELAYSAGITAQTASAHLSKLMDGGMVLCEKEGRHRYYRLAGPQVAQALEQLASIRPAVRRKPLSPLARELHEARCCYDHLAGRLGVAVTHALVEHRYLIPGENKLYEVTDSGRAWFGAMGVDVSQLKPTRRGIARQCLDWTERSHHLAGPLGVQFLAAMCDCGWLRRSRSTRLIQVTPAGWQGLGRQLGVEQRIVQAAPEA
ncbi:ArsR/SmtB family transcription factor [Candidimonas nitroreducens]|uniref:Transcriptional regulator n=1 Tax=Candidimonas nitroreducens TaxID=683354 RepID=A0A225M2R5_9BURK|nr:helix-turn-helix transcriptional regulator [Candidimonas nitroreducens]OWT55634.1 transcriptional regulator [Candidimonas nitroreducens]